MEFINQNVFWILLVPIVVMVIIRIISSTESKFIGFSPEKILSVQMVEYVKQEHKSIVCKVKMTQRSGDGIIRELILERYSGDTWSSFPRYYLNGDKLNFVNYDLQEILRSRMIQSFNDNEKYKVINSYDYSDVEIHNRVKY